MNKHFWALFFLFLWVLAHGKSGNPPARGGVGVLLSRDLECPLTVFFAGKGVPLMVAP